MFDEQNITAIFDERKGYICENYPAVIFCWWDRVYWGQKITIKVGLCFAVAASLLSSFHIIRHCCSSVDRSIKVCTLKILCMVPFYALNAAFCLIDSRSRFSLPEGLSAIREFYEAVVLVAFLQLVLNYLQGPAYVAAQFDEQMQKPLHPFCFHFIPTFFEPGLSFIWAILWGLLQFAWVMVFSTIVNLCILVCAQLVGIEDGSMRIMLMVPKTIKAASCGYAMYNLTLFYFEILRNKNLNVKFERINPEAKFICIKGVIMFTVFQDFIARCLANIGAFDSVRLAGPAGHGVAEPEDVATALKSFLLCIEMFLFSVLHLWAYPVEEPNLEPPPEGFEDELRVGWCGMFSDVGALSERIKEQRRSLKKLRRTPNDEAIERCFLAFESRWADGISVEQLRYILKEVGDEQDSIKPGEKAESGEERRISFEEFSRSLRQRAASCKSSSDDDSESETSSIE